MITSQNVLRHELIGLDVLVSEPQIPFIGDYQVTSSMKQKIC